MRFTPQIDFGIPLTRIQTWPKLGTFSALISVLIGKGTFAD